MSNFKALHVRTFLFTHQSKQQLNMVLYLVIIFLSESDPGIIAVTEND
jgi:hypothetical protein